MQRRIKARVLIANNSPVRRRSCRHDSVNWLQTYNHYASLINQRLLPFCEESVASAVPGSDNRVVTVRYAAERYLESRKDGSLNPIEQRSGEENLQPFG